MHLGASEGSLAVVKLLIVEAKCDPNPLDRWRNTPLDDSVREKREDVTAFLRENGGLSGKDVQAELDQAQVNALDEKYAVTHTRRRSTKTDSAVSYSSLMRFSSSPSEDG